LRCSRKVTQQSSNFLFCSTRQKLRFSQRTESPFTLRVHLEHRQGQSREHESDCRAFESATTEDAERDNRSKSAHTTSNTRALARTSSMSAADQPCTRPRSARLSRTEPKPPAAISLHAIPRTEARCTEFKRWNKETAASRANKSLFFVSRQAYAGKRVESRLQQRTWT
jgi:hypothetical protein